MQVAVVYAGDARDPSAWSGSVKGLSDALAAAGVNVVHVSATLPRRLERAVARAPGAHAAVSGARSAAVRARLVQLRHLDGIVQIGTEYTITTSVPTATYEDMTVVQHERHGDEWFMRFSPRERAAWHRRQRRGYANADVLCMMSKWAADSAIADYGVAPEKVRVVGVGANHLVPAPPQRDWSKPKFLVVARDWRRKNVPLVVETFGRLREDHPEAQLHVVGPYGEGGGPGVTLHGVLSLRDPEQRARVEGLFAEATCYVMPSRHEAAGLTFIEAATAGLPSIGTTVGGVRELIGPGGVVVDPFRPEQLLAAMRRLSSPEVASTLGERARRHAEWYTWPNVARRLLDALGLTHGAPRPKAT